MKWLTKLFKKEDAPIEPILEDVIDDDGKHVIHIMIHEKEVTLVFSDNEFKAAIKRGERISKLPREE
jgi:hypothetical protein